MPETTTSTTDFGFFLTVASSAKEPTPIQIQSMKKFQSGDESLIIDHPISLEFSKLDALLTKNGLTLPEEVRKRIDGLRLTLPFFYYNTGGKAGDGAGKGTPTLFFALEVGAFTEGGESKGLLTTLTGVEDLDTFFDILDLGIVVGKGPQVSTARKLLGQASLPASTDSSA